MRSRPMSFSPNSLAETPMQSNQVPRKRIPYQLELVELLDSLTGARENTENIKSDLYSTN